MYLNLTKLLPLFLLLTLSSQAQTKDGISAKKSVDAFNQLASDYKYNHVDSSLWYAQRAYHLANKMNYAEGSALALKHMGFAYFLKRNFDSSIYYNEMGIRAHEALHDIKGLARMYHQLGINYYNKYQFDLVLKYHLEGLKLNEKANYAYGICESYSFLASFYSARQEYSKSLEYYNKALKLAIDNQFTDKLPKLNTNIGAVYLTTHAPDTAIYFLNQAAMYETSNLTAAVIQHNLGDAYTQLKDYKKAQQHTANALKAYKLVGDKSGELFSQAAIALLTLKQGDYKEAIKTVNVFLPESIALNEANSTLQGYEVLHKSYAQLNDPWKAYQYSLLYDSVRAQIDSMSTAEKITQIQNKHETEASDLQIALLSKENHNQRVRLMAIVSISIAFLLLAVAILVYLRAQQKKKQFVLQQKTIIAEKKLEAENLKARFYANISHELKTPLTLILGPLEEASRKYEDSEHLQIALQNSKKLLSLVNQLLDLEKSDSGKLKLKRTNQDVVHHLSSLIESFSNYAKYRNIDYTLSTSLSSYIFSYDHQKLEIALINILSNAFKFTADGGQIRITIHGVEQKGITITIADNGPGIEQAHLPYLFDRFYQVDDTKASGGSGIGLSVSKEYIDLHQGQIKASSEIGKGSTFEIFIPYSWDKTLPAGCIHDSSAENAVTDGKAPRKIKRILIVDDNTDLKLYIASILRNKYK